VNFLLISDAKYFHTVIESVRRINKLYPESSIYFYDWGIGDDNLNILVESNKNVCIIDWKERISGIRRGENIYIPEKKDEKTIADLILNFDTKLYRRITKKFLYYLLKSEFVIKNIYKNLIYENIYL
jgi:hypothetical protein